MGFWSDQCDHAVWAKVIDTISGAERGKRGNKGTCKNSCEGGKVAGNKMGCFKQIVIYLLANVFGGSFKYIKHWSLWFSSITFIVVSLLVCPLCHPLHLFWSLNSPFLSLILQLFTSPFLLSSSLLSFPLLLSSSLLSSPFLFYLLFSSPLLSFHLLFSSPPLSSPLLLRQCYFLPVKQFADKRCFLPCWDSYQWMCLSAHTHCTRAIYSCLHVCLWLCVCVRV